MSGRHVGVVVIAGRGMVKQTGRWFLAPVVYFGMLIGQGREGAPWPGKQTNLKCLGNADPHHPSFV